MTAAGRRERDSAGIVNGNAPVVVASGRRMKSQPRGGRVLVPLLLPLLWTFALSLLSRIPLAAGEIFPYEDMELEFAHLIYRESGMFTPGRGFLEIGAGGGDGESFIRLTELKFRSDGKAVCDGSTSDCAQGGKGHVELAIFEQKSFGHVGVAVNNTRYYCCDSEAMERKACVSSQAGQLLLSDASDIWWHKRLELLPGVPTSLDHSDIYEVAETGMYVVLMGNCDPATGTILIDGHSEWKNPYGYLPGEEYGCLPFFFALAVVYLSLGVVWMVLCMAHIKDLLGVQMWASLVLFLGMVETGALYFDYRDWNLEGTRSPGAQSFAILFGAAKRALSLSLVLMVCMGYGVVRPSLGKDVHRIMGLALVYFVSSALFVALGNSSGGQDKEFVNRAGGNAAMILVFINSTIMVAFYMWILQSLFGVIEHLRARQQTSKLNLYLSFRRVLGGSAVFAVAWASYGVVRSSDDETERRWESYWIVNALWEVLYLAVLVAICFLLRPSINNQRFAYSSLPTGGKFGDDDEGDILLRSINPEDDEYGGSLDEGEDKGDEFSPAVPAQKPKPTVKKANQD